MADLLDKNNDPLFQAFVAEACNDLKHGAAKPQACAEPVHEAAPVNSGIDRNAALNEFAAGVKGNIRSDKASGLILPSGRPAVRENTNRDFKEEAGKEADSLLAQLLSATK